MLVDELLSKLDLKLELRHLLVVHDVEVLRVEERHLIRVVGDLIRLDSLRLRPGHVLLQDDRALLRREFWLAGITGVQVLHRAELNLDEELRAELGFVQVKVVRLVQASEVDDELLVDQVPINLELHHSEVDNDLAVFLASLEIHLMVRSSRHGASAICPGNSNFDEHGLVGLRGRLSFGLLEQDFEEAFAAWSEFNHIVSVVVDCEDVCDVEVARDKLLVVLNLVQEVREVRVLALLLERVQILRTDMVVLVVDLFAHLLDVAVKGETLHHHRFVLAGAVWVLIAHVCAHLAEVTFVAIVARADVGILVIAAKAVALELIRVKWRDADNCATLADLLSLGLERCLALHTVFACVRWRTNAFARLGLLGLGKRITATRIVLLH